MIGFIGAMNIEVDGLAAAIEGRETVRAGGLSFHKGRIGECDVVVAMCGVGKVNAAACAATMIAMFHPDEIVDIGVAGGLLKKDGMATGDIVVSTGVVQHDMDVSPLGYAPGLTPGDKSAVTAADERMGDRLADSAARCGTGKVFRGVIASGDQFVSSRERSREIAEVFGAAATEMEGAAVGHVCAEFDVPFCVMRTISDCADEEATVSYPEFCKAAAKDAIAIAKDYLAGA